MQAVHVASLQYLPDHLNEVHNIGARDGSFHIGEIIVAALVDMSGSTNFLFKI